MAAKPKLLSGGNPQIPKGEGDAPVQAYITAMPGWKQDVGRRLDALVERSVPNVRKAVKWNSPFYGTNGKSWFLSFHVFTRYVKVTFFRGPRWTRRHRARASMSTCAISTFTKASGTRINMPAGSDRRPSCQAGFPEGAGR